MAKIGNPLTYNNGKEYNFDWIDGRKLAEAEIDGTVTEYQYNVNGIRTGKKVGSTDIRYILDCIKIIREIRGSKKIDYYYDENNQIIGMKYDGTTYYFGKNIFGDVVEILSNGTVIAKYTYNAWGEILSVTDVSGNALGSTHVANVNPFRYRGYYYDTETGFYYLNSRYYDPVVKRFINADGQLNMDSLQGVNMYAYCEGNPVGYVDASGTRCSPVGEYTIFEGGDQMPIPIPDIIPIPESLIEIVEELEEDDSFSSSYSMNESHIYSELILHVRGWKWLGWLGNFGILTSKCKALEEAYLNYGESRPIVRFVMFLFGYSE